MRTFMKDGSVALKLYYFLAGFLLNAIVHRTTAAQASDVMYPVGILLCIVSIIFVNERRR